MTDPANQRHGESVAISRTRVIAAITAPAAVLLVVVALAWPTFPQPFLAAGRLLNLLGALIQVVAACVGWGGWLCRRLRIGPAPRIAQGALGAVAIATVWGYAAPWLFPGDLLAWIWLPVGWIMLALELRPAA